MSACLVPPVQCQARNSNQDVYDLSSLRIEVRFLLINHSKKLVNLLSENLEEFQLKYLFIFNPIQVNVAKHSTHFKYSISCWNLIITLTQISIKNVFRPPPQKKKKVTLWPTFSKNGKPTYHLNNLNYP